MAESEESDKVPPSTINKVLFFFFCLITVILALRSRLLQAWLINVTLQKCTSARLRISEGRFIDAMRFR